MTKQLADEINYRKPLWGLCILVTVSGVLSLAWSGFMAVKCGAGDSGIAIAYLVVGATLILVGSTVGLLNRFLPFTILARISEVALKASSQTEAGSVLRGGASGQS